MSENSTEQAPWPEQINAAAFKAHSNYFVGLDEMGLFKSMLSIRTMVGAGMVLALLLPTQVVAILAAAMTLPQLILTLARYFGILDDPLRKAHPVMRGWYTGEMEGDFCVFHIGLILNGNIPSKEMKQIGDAFNSMIKELEADPEKYGFLGATNYISGNTRVDSTMTIQYWRSQEHLNAYARERMSKHLPGMIWSSRLMKVSAHIGLWHESFTVRAGDYESIYMNCPRILLGKAGRLVPATGKKRTARGRLGTTDGDDLNRLGLPLNDVS